MNQLNHLFFPGNETKLRIALYNQLRPIFPTEVISTAIEAELTAGFKLDKYDDAIHNGDFCEGCKEPSCCTVAEVVALTDKDIDRLTKKGHKDFFCQATYDGTTFNTLKNCKPCQFLKKNRCTIYEYRPSVCRRYPMQVDTDTNKPFFLIAGDCCIAFNVMKQQIIDAIR